MTPQKRELLRNAILGALNEGAPYAIDLKAIRTLIKPYGFRSIDDEILRLEIDYLIGKQFAEIPKKEVSPENREWKITASGRDYLATEGLA